MWAAALQRLAEGSEVPAGYVPPFRVYSGGADPAEMSLYENEKRAPMHPADQYEAYARPRPKGMTAAEIGVAGRRQRAAGHERDAARDGGPGIPGARS